MDPADTNSLRHALASQGALVGQHDQTLREVMDTLRSSSASIHPIRTQVDLLTTQPSLPQLVAQSNLPTPAAACFPAQRATYSPTGALLWGLFQCSLVFAQKPGLRYLILWGNLREVL